jgi:putative Holliday junction resolvase
MTPRLLGIDYGTKRIGLAIADLDSIEARPYLTLRRASDGIAEIERLLEIVERERVTELVVGLPLKMDGSEDAWTLEVRAWAAGIEMALDLPVTMRDERLSSWSAEQRLEAWRPTSHEKRERRRAAIDREAAAVILGDELLARRRR